MADLNANLDWAQVPDDAKSAFRGVPQKVKVGPQFSVYKFTDSALVGSGRITPWWAPVEPYGEDAGLQARLGLARHLGADPGDLMRVVGAVSESWGNKMNNLLKAELLTSVWCFWGQCSMQPRRADGKGQTKNLPGYAWQLYIPNLTANDIRQTSLAPVTR